MSKIDITKKQAKVLELVQLGASNKEIAKRIGITESTVKTHMKCLLKAYAVKNRHQLAIYSSQGKAVDLPNVPLGMEDIQPSGWVKRNQQNVIGVYWGSIPPAEDWEPIYIPRKTK